MSEKNKNDDGRTGLRSSQAIAHTANISPRSGGVDQDGLVKDEDSAVQPLVNLTPHAIHALKCGGEAGSEATVVYPAHPQGPVRLRSTPQTLVDVRYDDVHVYTMPDFERDRLDNFPYDADDDASHPDVLVAGLVAPYVPRWFRGRVLVPDTGPESVIRDDKGRIQGVKRLYEVPEISRLGAATSATKPRHGASSAPAKTRDNGGEY